MGRLTIGSEKKSWVSRPRAGCGEAKGHVVVAGGLVGAHRDAPPLFQPVETPHNDVAAVAVVRVEHNGPARTLLAMWDLVVALRDRRLDAPCPQPCAVGIRWLSLVAAQPVRPKSWTSRGRDPDLFNRRRQHGGVDDLTAGYDEPEWSASAVANEMCLRREPAARPADRMIRRLSGRLVVVRSALF